MTYSIDYQSICKKAVNAATTAGKFIRSRMGRQFIKKIEVKGTQNFVTEVDKASESMIIKMLTPILPDAGFIAEENTSEKKGLRYNWVIDPLDGTTNFIHGAPPVSVSIALLEDNEIVIGVVYEVWHHELYHTWKGGSAFLNNEKIQVSDAVNIQDALIATGFPYENFDRVKPFMQSLDHFFRNSNGVRRLGSAAADLAYVACGRYDAFYEYNLKPWDVAAGAFLVEQAGGKVSDFRGGNDFIFGRECIAANSNVYPSFLHDVGRIMNQH